jgi:hypothetical protein
VPTDVEIPASEENAPPVALNVTAVAITPYIERIPPARTIADCAVPEVVSLYNKPFDIAIAGAAVCVAAAAVALPFAWVATNKAVPDIDNPVVPLLDNVYALALLAVPPAAGCVALAAGEATDNIPTVKAETAITAMRLRSVVFDIFFLSLVRGRNFLNLARRSFDPLIPFPYGTHV